MANTHARIMQDWQAADGAESVDKRHWEVQVRTDRSAINIKANCPDGTEREVWIEIADGNLVVHCYDPAHDEPLNVRIGKDEITTDSDR